MRSRPPTSFFRRQLLPQRRARIFSLFRWPLEAPRESGISFAMQPRGRRTEEDEHLTTICLGAESSRRSATDRQLIVSHRDVLLVSTVPLSGPFPLYASFCRLAITLAEPTGLLYSSQCISRIDFIRLPPAETAELDRAITNSNARKGSFLYRLTSRRASDAR